MAKFAYLRRQRKIIILVTGFILSSNKISNPLQQRENTRPFCLGMCITPKLLALIFDIYHPHSYSGASFILFRVYQRFTNNFELVNETSFSKISFIRYVHDMNIMVGRALVLKLWRRLGLCSYIFAFSYGSQTGSWEWRVTQTQQTAKENRH